MKKQKQDLAAPDIFAELSAPPATKAKRVKQIIPPEQFADLHLIESDLYAQGYVCIAGLDEAGRGPLAGPVCAGLAVLAPDVRIEGVNDSKKLTEAKREKLFDDIRERALAYAVAVADPAEIDAINILQATKLACRRCIEQVRAGGIHPDYLLLDALQLPDVPLPQQGLIKGDARSFSIAAASILAKVTRDRLMVQAAEEWPQYGFEKHKGYPTKAHYDAVAQHGASTMHRGSFLHVDMDALNLQNCLIRSKTLQRIMDAVQNHLPIPDECLKIAEQNPPVLPKLELEFIGHLLQSAAQ